MGQLRDRMEADLRLAGYSPSTRKIYLGYARLFAKHHMRSPAEMGEVSPISTQNGHGESDPVPAGARADSPLRARRSRSRSGASRTPATPRQKSEAPTTSR